MQIIILGRWRGSLSALHLSRPDNWRRIRPLRDGHVRHDVTQLSDLWHNPSAH